MFLFATLILIPALVLAQGSVNPVEDKFFGALDLDSDGKITEPESESYFQTYDTNKDNKISKQEFTATVDKLDPIFTGHEDVLFTLFDRNNDGTVDKTDIATAFGLADANSDGVVDKSEFHTIFQIVITSLG